MKIQIETNHPLDLGKQKVFYRRKHNSKTLKYKQDKVDKVFFDGVSNEAYGYFQFIPIRKNKKVLMRLIIDGKQNYILEPKKCFHLRTPHITTIFQQ